MGDDITIGVTEIVNNIEVTAQPNDQIVDISVTDNSDDVTLNITPTVVEVNINKGGSFAKWGDLYGTLSDQTDLQNALNLKANLVGGKVPASELPSYVDDIIEVANYAALPATGETGKIYVTLDNNKIYRWSGSVYIEIASNSAIWGAITGTLGDQTDLQNALNAKQAALSGTGFVKISGTTISYDNSTYALDSDVVKVTTDQNVRGIKTFLGNQTATTLKLILADYYNDGFITSDNGMLRLLNGTTELFNLASTGDLTAKSFVKTGGTSSQFLKANGTVDSTTYLSGTVAIANGGTGATTAGAARTNLGATTVGANIFTIPNPNPVTKAYIRANADNTVEWLDGNAFRESIGAGTGNGTVTSVNGTGSYGGLTLTGTVTGSGDLTLGGTPTGTWPISVSGNAASVNTVFNTTNADHYITFADANNGSPTAEFLYTVGTLKYNPNTGALTAGSFVKSGGTSSQFLMADGSVSTGSGGTVTSVAAITLGTTGTDLSSTVANGTTTPVITLNVPTASATNRGALSAADWTTFNSKQNALTNPVTGTGTSGQVAFWNGTSSITGESNLFWDSTNDRLGIGNASPSSKLHVNLASNENVSLGSLFTIPTGRTLILQTTSNGGQIDTYSSITSSYVNTLINSSGGNVLIGGTTDAGYKLDVNGTGRFSGLLEIIAASATEQFRIGNTTGGTDFGITVTENASTIINSAEGATGRGIQFQSGGTNTVLINSSGNVGIGTTSPNINSYTRALTILASSGYAGIEVYGGSTTSGAQIDFGGSTDRFASISGEYESSNNGFLNIRTRRAGSMENAMRITSGGNVGIGTTSPVGKLDVVGSVGGGGIVRLIDSATECSIGYKINGSTGNTGWVTGNANNDFFMYSYTYANPVMTLKPSGNVGINTTSPTQKLAINQGATGFNQGIPAASGTTQNGILRLQPAVGTYGETLDFGMNVATTYAWIQATNTDSLAVNYPIAINPNGGNVLIGTTTDAGTKVNINGNTRISGASTILQLHCTTGTAQNWWLGQDVSGSGDGTFYLYNQTSGVQSFNMTKSNNATFAGTVTATGFFNSSDNRLKELTDYDYNISDIKPITYLWKDGRDNKKHVGYSAQEVQKVMPDAVNEDEKGFLSVNYVEVLVAKIAELENRIKQLEK